MNNYHQIINKVKTSTMSNKLWAWKTLSSYVNVFADYDGPSISNGSPSPQINGSSTTQSIRSTHSDLSSQGNSMQVDVSIRAQWHVWALYLHIKASTLNLCLHLSVSSFLAGRWWRWPAVWPLCRDGPESQRYGGRRKDEGPCQRKEEGPADGLDEEAWALQQFLRHSALRTRQRRELCADPWMGDLSTWYTDSLLLRQRTKITLKTEDIFILGFNVTELFEGFYFLSDLIVPFRSSPA